MTPESGCLPEPTELRRDEVDEGGGDLTLEVASCGEVAPLGSGCGRARRGGPSEPGRCLVWSVFAEESALCTAAADGVDAPDEATNGLVGLRAALRARADCRVSGGAVRFPLRVGEGLRGSESKTGLRAVVGVLDEARAVGALGAVVADWAAVLCASRRGLVFVEGWSPRLGFGLLSVMAAVRATKRPVDYRAQ